MLPFMAIMGVAGAGARLYGGFRQAGEIEAATEERLRLMRLQAGQETGASIAAVGGTGVELTTSSIQNRLNRMQAEWDRQIANVARAGDQSANNALISGIAGGVSSFASSMYQASKVTAAFGEGQPSLKPGASDFDWGGTHEGWT